MTPRRVMLTLPAESLAVIREVVLECRSAASPVAKAGSRTKKPRRANEDYLNSLTLAGAAESALAAHKALPEGLRDEKPTVYLTPGEFQTVTWLLQRKSRAADAKDNKYGAVWRELTLAGIEFDRQYGPDFLHGD